MEKSVIRNYSYSGSSKKITKSNKLRVRNLVLFVFLTSLFLVNITAQPLAEGQDKFLGAASSHYIYRHFGDYFNQITPGNAGKWGSVEYSLGNYNWSNLDQIYNFAKSRDLLFKDHVLIWGQQQPGWISSLDTAAQRETVENWIKAVAERYPRMAMIDVVNEPLHDLPSYKDALGGDGETGWDWVITSFELARKYFPDSTKLILNEYNVLGSSSAASDYLEIINLLQERGLIDGIGIQGHYFEFRSDIGSSNSYKYGIPTIKSNLQKFVDTGIPVYITEFDIDEPDDQNQLEQYQIYFPIFWSNPGVKGITLWGYYEDDVWSSHPNTYLITSRGAERPALEWMRNYILLPHIPVIISPTVTSELVPIDPVLSWYSSETAISYHVQVSQNRALSNTIVDTVLADTLLQLDTLEANTRYYWRVSAANENGTSDFSEIESFTTEDRPTSVGQGNEKPLTYELYQNYPNPFNPSTKIKFTIPNVRRSATSQNVRRSATSSYTTKIVIYDVLGSEIQTLVNENKAPGTYEVTFDGSGLPSGVYFYKISSGSFSSFRKMILMK